MDQAECEFKDLIHFDRGFTAVNLRGPIAKKNGIQLGKKARHHSSIMEEEENYFIFIIYNKLNIFTLDIKNN